MTLIIGILVVTIIFMVLFAVAINYTLRRSERLADTILEAVKREEDCKKEESLREAILTIAERTVKK